MDDKDRPKVEVKVVSCGQLPDGCLDYGLGDGDGTEDVFPYHPEDLDLDWYLKENFEKVLFTSSFKNDLLHLNCTPLDLVHH